MPVIVLFLDPVAPRPPRLPHRRLGALTPLAASVALHATLVVIAASVETFHGVDDRGAQAISRQPRPDVTHLVFLTPEMPRAGGGGGGGNRQPEPIRRAQGVGSDAITLRVHREPPPTAPLLSSSAPAIDVEPTLPSLVLEAKPLASGILDQVGLPTGGSLSGTSAGPGSGGGVGSGVGTGMGSGSGPGLGPGTGGGTGGGVYRVGGAVTAPRAIKEVPPRYTNDALRQRIQGTVVLEAVVKADGCTSQIRVVRSLDRGGLDEEAIAAAAQWRFEPGRLNGAPVAVLVTIWLDFRIR